MGKTNLCFFNTTRFWGGGEKWHFETARFMASQGHRVTAVVHPDGALAKRLADIPQIQLITMPVSNLSFLNPFKHKKLIDLFRHKGTQTVVFNGSSDVKLGAPAARMAGVPAIVYRRGLAVAVKNSVLNRFIYGRLITHFLTNSQATQQELFKYLTLPRQSLHTQTIYNGVDLSRFQASIAQQRQSNDASDLVIGTAGRLEREKGHDHLLVVAELLKKDKKNFRLLIAGEGSRRNELEKQIEELKLTDSVQLLGFVSETDRFLEQIDIFAFPSLWEGFGFATAEAMAAAKPVVAFAVGSNPEVVEEGETGFLVPLGDTNQFAEKVSYLLETPEVRYQMGQKGRERALAMFARDKQLRKLEVYLCRTVLGR